MKKVRVVMVGIKRGKKPIEIRIDQKWLKRQLSK
jgi:hypothetical protein